MRKKLMLLSIGAMFLLAIALIVAAANNREAIKAEISPVDLQLNVDRAATCQMYKFNASTTSISALTGYVNGDMVVTYFDPTDPTTNGCGVAATYPYQINSLSFMLKDYAGAVWPVTVDVVVYSSTGDPCAGPRSLMCSQTVTCDQASFDGVFGTVAFSSPCCVGEPFFIGLKYNDAGSGPYPAFVSDASLSPPAVVMCDQWDVFNGAAWTEWYSGWGDPPPDYLMFVVNGTTESWTCGYNFPNHKMHFPQLPDEDGWDVHVDYPYFLADDWTCTETGPVTDIHWWGSWLGGNEGTIDQFVIKIWSDVPADQADPASYSHPGEELQTILAPPGYFVATPIDPTDINIWQGWYDPSIPSNNYPDHQQYFQYDLILNEQDWFDQVQGTVYWLSIECLVVDDGTGAQWGWKNTENHYLDDAVWGNVNGWTDIYEPGEVLSNWFEIQIDPTGLWAGGYGVGAYMQDPLDPYNGWYFYEEADPGWWNIWFYDHPLDYKRIKDIWIEYTVRRFDEGIQEMYAEVTPNWATGEWTELGMPPEPEDPRPPLPSDFLDGTPESDWIGRGTPNVHYDPDPDGRYAMRIWEYNPEWVSVDVRGTNAWVEGTIYHNCRASLDLAFVITNDYEPPVGACCYPDPLGLGAVLCAVTTAANCVQSLGGTYQGDGTTCGGSVEACCLPDGSCIMADTYCCTNDLGGTPQGAGSVCSAPEACCFTDGTCQDLDPLCCVSLGGTPQGAGTDCASTNCNPEPEGACCYYDPTGSGNMLCVVTTAADCGQNIGGTYQGDGTTCGGSIEACCLPDGSCVNADIYCCVNELGGTPQGAGSVCTAVEACCMTDGSCQMLDPLCCVDLGGSPQGSGSTCTNPQACCLTDGSCRMLDPLCCSDLGGTPMGQGTDCASVTCEAVPETPKNIYQAPDLTTTGMDVLASGTLADDFLCTKTEPIKEIHIWGSWLNDIYPGADPPDIPGDPGNISFLISLHADIPAGVAADWSMPGDILQEWEFGPGSFIYKKIPLTDDFEGWYDPVLGGFTSGC